MLTKKATDHVIECDGIKVTVPALGYWRVKEARAMEQLQNEVSNPATSFSNIEYVLDVIKIFAESRGFQIEDIEDLSWPLIRKIQEFFLFTEGQIERNKEGEEADPKAG